MPGQVYAVASGKGGVGKTTTVVNLGVALRIEGRSVALVDADLGMANLAAFLGVDHDQTIHDVLAGEANVGDAVVESAEEFAVVPGDRSLDAFAAADPSDLDEVVEHVSARYDVVLVDTGAGIGYEEILPLGLVNGVLLVTTPDPAAAGDTRKTAQLTERLGRTVEGIVVTRAGEEVDAEGIADAIGYDLLGTVPEDPLLVESSAAGKPVRTVDPDAPSVAAFTRLAKRLLGEDVPDADVERGGTTTADDGADTAAVENRDAETDADDVTASAEPFDPAETTDGDTDRPATGVPDDTTGETAVAAADDESAAAGAAERDEEETGTGEEDAEVADEEEWEDGPDDRWGGKSDGEDADPDGEDTDPDESTPPEDATDGAEPETDDGEVATAEVAEPVTGNDDEEDSGGLLGWFR